MESVRNRFGPSKFKDPQGALSKLLQIGSVVEYQSEFEKLMYRVTDISDTLLISFYISGLKLSLQRELLRARPTSLGDAFSLARVVEARFEGQQLSSFRNKTNINNKESTLGVDSFRGYERSVINTMADASGGLRANIVTGQEEEGNTPPFPERVQVGGSPLYKVVRKLRKDGFGQVFVGRRVLAELIMVVGLKRLYFKLVKSEAD